MSVYLKAFKKKKKTGNEEKDINKGMFKCLDLNTRERSRFIENFQISQIHVELHRKTSIFSQPVEC